MMKINTDDFEHTVENLYAKNKSQLLSIYSISLPLMVILLIITCLSSIDVSVQCRGIIRSSGENIPLTSLQSGRIIYQKMAQNLAVKKNDTLIVLDSKEMIDEKEILEKELELNRSMVEDYKKAILLTHSNFNNLSIQKDYMQYEAHLKELEVKSKQSELKFKRDQTLFQEKVIPLIEYERSSFENEITLEILNGFKKDNIARWQFEITKIISESTSLIQEINKKDFAMSHYIIKAPITGHITNFTGITQNSNILSGQILAEISPHINLIIECIIRPENIGFIHKNQRVQFNMDAFNHNQWGSLKGIVLEIDQNPKVLNKQMVFMVRCRYLNQDLMLKNGLKGKISKGMTLTGNFFLVKRRILDLLFDRVDNWLNPSTLNAI